MMRTIWQTVPPLNKAATRGVGQLCVSSTEAVVILFSGKSVPSYLLSLDQSPLVRSQYAHHKLEQDKNTQNHFKCLASQIPLYKRGKKQRPQRYKSQKNSHRVTVMRKISILWGRCYKECIREKLFGNFSNSKFCIYLRHSLRTQQSI